jgi:hypothetical protein
VGRSQGIKDYFWKHVKLRYPDLWQALHRIKVYRNEQLHLELTPQVDADLRSLLKEDLGGRRLTQVAEPYFTLQQIVIDELFIGLQCELDRLS